MRGVDVMDWPLGSYRPTIKGKNIVLSINSKRIECHSFCCMATALRSQQQQPLSHLEFWLNPPALNFQIFYTRLRGEKCKNDCEMTIGKYSAKLKVKS